MAKIKAFSGVNTAGNGMIVGWLLIAGLAGLMFWGAMRPVKKRS